MSIFSTSYEKSKLRTHKDFAKIPLISLRSDPFRTQRISFHATSIYNKVPRFTSMELPKYDPRSVSNQKKLPSKRMHKSGSGSRDILHEQETTSPEEDVIMSDENWSYVTDSEDTYMDDEYYTDGTHTGDTTIYRQSSGLAPQVAAPVKSYAPAQAPQKRYVPAPRRYRGILDPYESAEDAAFFAHANTRYQQGIREVLCKSEERSKEKKPRSARKENTVLAAETNAAPTTTGWEKINFIDLLWGDA
ncbi:hypothetical protein BPAE_0122g00110 [Botrytis paeoniae]|uniref:Uncharacterized protein n=1 Tax=Botrytis paeoniae TaxID=278948 RepID=A0A4Z1FH51_9HELO|nr:hypothetical protein BPAE_0122g00110 [Botrytis paeoniae]